jgi:hypothetical protein
MTNLTAIYRASAVKNNKGELTGNYSGYDATGTRENRIHIPKAVAESFGVDKATTPFFAVVSQETYPMRDESDKPILDSEGEPKMFTQKRAGNLFAKEEDAIQAINANAKLSAKAKADLNKLGKELQLTDAVLAELINAPF